MFQNLPNCSKFWQIFSTPARFKVKIEKINVLLFVSRLTTWATWSSGPATSTLSTPCVTLRTSWAFLVSWGRWIRATWPSRRHQWAATADSIPTWCCSTPSTCWPWPTQGLASLTSTSAGPAATTSLKCSGGARCTRWEAADWVGVRQLPRLQCCGGALYEGVGFFFKNGSASSSF